MLAATWEGLLLVVGGTPLPGWAVAGACLLAPVILLATRRTARARVPLAVVVPALVVGALVVGLAALADVVYGAAYRPIEPASAGGCRVVVRETAFLQAGRGEVFVVHGATGIARRASTYTADDGYRPFTTGDVTLSWHRGVGTLEGLGPDYDPLDGGGHAFTCD